MTLFVSLTSPFARKARVVLKERGLEERVKQEITNPWQSEARLLAVNPLSQIPALVLEDGSALIDSPVICAYLDELAGPPVLHPQTAPAKWIDRRRTALADGMIDAAILVVMESRRPEDKRHAPWSEAQTAKLARGLDALEAEAESLNSTLTMGTLSIVVALDYLAFRLPGLNWRAGRPKLAAWYDVVSQRPSLIATRPVEG
ncbi:MAG: hypothetical protein A2516_04675 [Alphaproteobacteria bacterium RIFOXYD12_FULL_60_8]|nr:MAG: hypothetical protein A2516_04675 [Alphaproteobacteria bacterium RIFOXYD12_FULL_60_8]